MIDAKLPKAVMFQGTGSDVGKSFLVAGLCRALYKREKVVRPFKPQNMSNNAAVTDDGGEIGRAQALQAKAARMQLTSFHMNPVLLKPQTDSGAQIIVHGKVFGNAQARDYHNLKPQLLNKVLESFKIIGNGADFILVEGAGSPAELNLRAGDIANMGFAEAADVPVILVADIDRGGVIASLVGTHAVMTKNERLRVKGFIINKFKGDKTLFESGVEIIQSYTSWPCFGIVPHFSIAYNLPQEDSMALDNRRYQAGSKGSITIAVPRLPRIANFDDLDPFVQEPDVSMVFLETGQPLPADTDIVFIPGSKSTLSDLKDLRSNGWDIDILAHHRRGGVVIGICGGFQILGSRVNDPGGIEGLPGSTDGLGLLNISTVISGEKTLKKVRGTEVFSGENFVGYEMHIGETTGPDTNRPWLSLFGNRDEGASSEDGLVLGAYIHGLFASDGFRGAFLDRFRSGRTQSNYYDYGIDKALDEIANGLEEHVNIDALISL